MAIIRGWGWKQVYFLKWEGWGMFNTNRNILVEDSKRRGCKYFPCPLHCKEAEKPRLAMTLIYYSVQLDATYRNGSFEKNVSDIINLRTCI